MAYEFASDLELQDGDYVALAETLGGGFQYLEVIILYMAQAEEVLAFIVVEDFYLLHVFEKVGYVEGLAWFEHQGTVIDQARH